MKGLVIREAGSFLKTMKSKLLLLAGLSLVSIIMVLVLYGVSRSKQSIKNGFSRSEGVTLTLLKQIKLDREVLYFSGWVDEVCYLSNPDRPYELLAVDGNRQSIVSIEDSLEAQVRVGKVVVSPPYFFVSDLNQYFIYRGEIARWNLNKVIHPQQFFSESVPIGSASTILRSFNENKTEYVLKKEDPESDEAFGASKLLQKQVDGLFCVDGVLSFDEVENKIFYTYFYRNQFICADTSLQLLYRANTIDTTRVAKIKVAKSATASMLSSPPHIVNRYSFAAAGGLFINSNLQADNERAGHFRTHDVIDVYRTVDGQYVESLYIKKIAGQRIQGFAIHSDCLFALRGEYLEVYGISKVVSLL